MFSYLKPRYKFPNSSASTSQLIEQIPSLKVAFTSNQRLVDSSLSQYTNLFESKTTMSPATPRMMHSPNSTDSEDKSHASFTRTLKTQIGKIQTNISEDARSVNAITTKSVDNTHHLSSGSAENRGIKPSDEQNNFKTDNSTKNNIPSIEYTSTASINDGLDLDRKRSKKSLRKTKFNLLNSIPQLVRRRVSQSSSTTQESSKLSCDRDLPLTEKQNIEYDPSIRGTFVHDFSAPRKPGVNYSILKVKCINDVISCPSRNQPSPDSIATNESPNTPWGDDHYARIFTERSEDEPYLNLEELNPKTYSLTDLVLSNAQCFPLGSRRRKSYPVPTQPNCVKNGLVKDNLTDWNVSKNSDSSEISKNMKCDSTVPLDASDILTTAIPPLPQTRHSICSDTEEIALNTDNMSIKRSSRFSFEMAGILAQEKEMEETYRRKELQEKEMEETYRREELQKKNEAEKIYQMLKSQDSHSNCESSEYDLENWIPDLSVESGVHNFHERRILSLLHAEVLCEKARLERARIERDEYEISQRLRHDPETVSYTRSNDTLLNLDEEYFFNTPISTTFTKNQELKLAEDLHLVNRRSLDLDEMIHWSTSSLIDEFYFHDGEIDAPLELDSSKIFDKPILDEMDTDLQSSHSILPICTEIVSPIMHRPQSPVTRQKLEITRSLSSHHPTPLITHRMFDDPATHISMLEHLNSEILENKTSDLTEDSLAVYQSALAHATFIAEANGRFRRDSNKSNGAILHQDLSQSDSTTDSHSTQSHEFLSFYDESEDSFDLEDHLHDEDIISQVNAEALANDTEGYYGNEFGFYPITHKPGKGVIYKNGGYFESKAPDCLQWSQTGRFGLHEPNLTPITERSEYSNRNSYISPAIHSPSPVRDISSPGMSQLMDLMLNEEDYDMKLELPWKFRREAWIGS